MIDNQPGKFYFTVGQLMEILKTIQPDLPVLVNGYKSGYENFFQPMVVKMTHKPENWFEYGEFEVAQEGDKETFEAVVLERVNRDGQD